MARFLGQVTSVQLLAPRMSYPGLVLLGGRGLHACCNYCNLKSNDCRSNFVVELKALNGANLVGEVIPFIRWRKQISFQVHKPFLTLLLLLLSHIGAIRNEGIALEGKHIMQVFKPAGNCSLLTGICLMICWSESQQQGQASEGAGSAEFCWSSLAWTFWSHLTPPTKRGVRTCSRFLLPWF